MSQHLKEIPAIGGKSSNVWPKVTVIVPVYNQIRYVERTLDSVLDCGYPNIEIIIIDDASSDGSQSAVRSWCEKHPSWSVTFVEHPINMGVCKTLNDAIEHAQGDYVCLLAADDLLLPNGIVDRVQYLEQHPEKLAVFADCQVIDADGNLLYNSGIEDLYPAAGMRKALLAFDELIPSSIVFHWAVPGPVFMCRAETYNSIGRYDETLQVEDWDMYLRIAAENKLGFIPTSVARYRVHQFSMCATRQERISIDMYTVAKKNCRHFGFANALRLRSNMKKYQCARASSRFARLMFYLQHLFFLKTSVLFYRLKRKAIVLKSHRRISISDR